MKDFEYRMKHIVNIIAYNNNDIENQAKYILYLLENDEKELAITEKNNLVLTFQELSKKLNDYANFIENNEII